MTKFDCERRQTVYLIAAGQSGSVFGSGRLSITDLALAPITFLKRVTVRSQLEAFLNSEIGQPQTTSRRWFSIAVEKCVSVKVRI